MYDSNKLYFVSCQLGQVLKVVRRAFNYSFVYFYYVWQNVSLCKNIV